MITKFGAEVTIIRNADNIPHTVEIDGNRITDYIAEARILMRPGEAMRLRLEVFIRNITVEQTPDELPDYTLDNNIHYGLNETEQTVTVCGRTAFIAGTSITGKYSDVTCSLCKQITEEQHLPKQD